MGQEKGRCRARQRPLNAAGCSRLIAKIKIFRITRKE